MPRAGGIVLYLVVGGALPTQMFLVPLFLLWARLGLLDSLFGLIVVYWALFSPFATLLLRSFLVSLPPELEEAARIDGASELHIPTRGILPIAAPGFLTVGLVAGLSAYNRVPVCRHLHPGHGRDAGVLGAVLLPAGFQSGLHPAQRRRVDHAAADGPAVPVPPTPVRPRHRRCRSRRRLTVTPGQLALACFGCPT